MAPPDIYLLSEGKGEVFTPKILYQNDHIIRFGAENLMTCDEYNRNDRDYPWALVDQALKNPFITERLATSTWYCEAGHPPEKSVERQTTINRLLASTILKSITKTKPIISGIIETCANQLGRDLRDLILYNGAVVAFSMRSLGKLKSVSEAGRQRWQVIPPLYITNWDEVVHPSVAKAYMNCEIKRSIDGKQQSALSEQTSYVGTDLASAVPLDESMLTQFMTGTNSHVAEVLDWLELNESNVHSSYNAVTGRVSMHAADAGKTLVIPTAGRLRIAVEDYLCNL